MSPTAATSSRPVPSPCPGRRRSCARTRPSERHTSARTDRPDPRPVLSTTGPAGNGPAVLVAVALIVAILAVVKPWGATPTPDGAIGSVTTSGASGAPIARATPTPSPSPTPSAEELLQEHCLAPGGWRIFSIERWRNQTARSWVAIRPVAAAGPSDPAIPFVAVIASGIPALGYCAPVVGPERPAAGATMTVWRLSDDGASASRLVLERIVPPIATILGGLYAPPVAGGSAPEDAGSWGPGRYVFEVDGHWFGAEVRLDRPADDRSPMPSPP